MKMRNRPSHDPAALAQLVPGELPHGSKRSGRLAAASLAAEVSAFPIFRFPLFLSPTPCPFGEALNPPRQTPTRPAHFRHLHPGLAGQLLYTYIFLA